MKFVLRTQPSRIRERSQRKGIPKLSNNQFPDFFHCYRIASLNIVYFFAKNRFIIPEDEGYFTNETKLFINGKKDNDFEFPLMRNDESGFGFATETQEVEPLE